MQLHSSKYFCMDMYDIYEWHVPEWRGGTYWFNPILWVDTYRYLSLHSLQCDCIHIHTCMQMWCDIHKTHTRLAKQFGSIYHVGTMFSGGIRIYIHKTHTRMARQYTQIGTTNKWISISACIDRYGRICMEQMDVLKTRDVSMRAQSTHPRHILDSS